MTPAEVIAMRDKLAKEYDDTFGRQTDGQELADWLIETGWVVAPPKNEGENK